MVERERGAPRSGRARASAEAEAEAEAEAIVAEARRQAAEILAQAERDRAEPSYLSVANLARVLGWTEGQVCTVLVGLALVAFGLLAGVVPALRHRPAATAAFEVPGGSVSRPVAAAAEVATPAATVTPAPALSGPAEPTPISDTGSGPAGQTGPTGQTGAGTPVATPAAEPALPAVGSASVFATAGKATAGGVAVASDRSVLVAVDRGGRGVVLRYRPDGTLERRYELGSLDGTVVSGVGEVVVGGHDDAYIAVARPAAVIRLDLASGNRHLYADVPDVSPCFLVLVQGSCEPGVVDHPPRPWGLVLDPAGRLYVGDQGQGMIWRVPPKGGAIEAWAGSAMFGSPANGGGPAGLALAGDGSLLVGVPESGVDGHGALDRVAVGTDGRAGAVSEVATFASGARPAGVADDPGGTAYVVLSGRGTVALVGADGTQRGTLPAAGATATALTNPLAITLRGDDVLVTDQPDPTSARVVRITVGTGGSSQAPGSGSKTANGGYR